MLYAGSLVFSPPVRAVDLRDWSRWWQFMKGADWRHPYGPKSNINVLDNHPVVHIAYGDALAYAHWAGKDLPTEAEWEFAARGGLADAESYDSCHPNIRIPRKVLKGGSHLCAPNYCRRYRPAARHAEPIDTSASHVGFRCITRKRITS